MSNAAMIEERLRFLAIDEVVIEDLRKARELLEPALDQMLDAFYSHVSDEAQLKDLFPDDGSMAKARNAQKVHWLESLLAGEFTSDHFDRTERIGRAHARVGVTPNWYIGGYSNMLAQFVQHILVERSEENSNASSLIEALCKAVLLDVDLVIHSYLEAKDRVIFDVLLHATRFIDNLAETNATVRSASDKVKESAEQLLRDSKDSDQKTEALQQLLADAGTVTNELRDLDKRIDELKSSERLYLQRGSEHTGTFSQLVSQIIDQ